MGSPLPTRFYLVGQLTNVDLPHHRDNNESDDNDVMFVVKTASDD